MSEMTRLRALPAFMPRPEVRRGPYALVSWGRSRARDPRRSSTSPSAPDATAPIAVHIEALLVAFVDHALHDGVTVVDSQNPGAGRLAELELAVHAVLVERGGGG